MSSDVARGEVGHLEVSEFPELWIEFAPDGLRHRRGSRQHFRGVGQRAVHVGHLAEFRSQTFEQRSGLGAGIRVVEWRKVRHSDDSEGLNGRYFRHFTLRAAHAHLRGFVVPSQGTIIPTFRLYSS